MALDRVCVWSYWAWPWLGAGWHATGAGWRWIVLLLVLHCRDPGLVLAWPVWYGLCLGCSLLISGMLVLPLVGGYLGLHGCRAGLPLMLPGWGIDAEWALHGMSLGWLGRGAPVGMGSLALYMICCSTLLAVCWYCAAMALHWLFTGSS
jgi:hypothetical protein